jgi:hypothetical protein
MWRNDHPHGFGLKLCVNGDRHEGEYRDDRREGHGTYTWKNGDKYEGSWVAGQMSGQGIKSLVNGDKYSGAWLKNEATGFGVKTFANGDRHEGEYLNDLRHGYGLYVWVTGDRFEGFWHYGAQTGRGTYTFASGDVFKGKWENGKKVGRGIFTRGGESWLEEWEDGVRTSRTSCKFYPPRLLRTQREDGFPALNGLNEAASIRNEIDRLRNKLAAIQRGDQWQQHVQSSAFNSLVSRSVAAMLSPEQSAPPTGTVNNLAAAVPSPAAAIEAAAADLSIDMAVIDCVSNSPSVSPSSGPMDSNAENMELLTVTGCISDTRPISPNTTCRPSSATADATMPASAITTAGASTARCATPQLPQVNSSTASSGHSPRTSSTSPLPDDQLCKVCFVSEINTVLLPCAHVAVCLECSTQLERCCICRTNISDAIQTFKA